MNIQAREGRLIVGLAGLFLGMMLFCPYGRAVVGQAERYDPFKEENLEEFHEQILNEEAEASQDELAMSAQAAPYKSARPLSSEESTSNVQLQDLNRELLGIPKKDRIRFGFDSYYTYDSNIERKNPGNEDGDSVFDETPSVQFDLSGRKTDLRFEVRGVKQWNIKFPKKDIWGVEERLRYRRRYWKKISHSVQSRFARLSDKTIEVNQKRVRYDSYQNTVFNYELSRKFSINTEINANKRLFTTEAFDQDSSWETTVAPAFFWHMTPKSRLSGGYTIGTNRIRTKVGNAVSHEFHLGYFGRVTRKSSISFDTSYAYQSPRSLETPTAHTINVGTGYIYQVTPKTQMILQVLRSQQNSSSDASAGVSDQGDNFDTAKSDVSFTNNSVSFSLNSRLTRKINAVLNFTASHLKTAAPEGSDSNTITQFSFPSSIAVDYLLKRWIRVRLAYSFAFRTGYEKTDNYRAHILTTGVNATF